MVSNPLHLSLQEVDINQALTLLDFVGKGTEALKERKKLSIRQFEWSLFHNYIHTDKAKTKAQRQTSKRHSWPLTALGSSFTLELRADNLLMFRDYKS